MKNKTVSWLPALFGLLLLTGCATKKQETTTSAKIYQAKGVVYAVEREAGVVIITHDEIPGLMGAMTMGFAVKNKQDLDAIAARDEVSFTVSVGEGEYMAANIEKQTD